MAKPQDSKKAAKKEKTVKVKTAGLSEDRVVDSDSESEQKNVKTPVKVAEKVKKTKTSTRKTVPPPPPPPPAKAESSEDEDGSDDSHSDDLDGDDESTASESGGMAVAVAEPAKKVNGVKRKSDENSSSEEEASDSDESMADADISQPAPKKAKTTPKAPSPAQSEEEAEAVPLSSIPAASFAAPKDYHLIDTTKLHSTFPSNLSGKQIWHITAPSSLPMSEIKSVGLAAIGNGSTILTHKGSEYRLSEDTTTSNQNFSVFLPGKEGYKRSQAPVEKTLRFQQKIELPKLTSKQAKTETGGEAAADVWKPVEEGARPQPKGMRMRYKPPGFGIEEPGLGSDDEEDAGFKLPKSKKAKKARRESGDAMEGVEATSKELSKEERKRAKKEAKAKAAKGA